MKYFAAKYNISNKKVEVFVRQYQNDHFCYMAELHYKVIEKRSDSYSRLFSKLEPTNSIPKTFSGWAKHDLPLSGEGLNKLEKKVLKYLRCQLIPLPKASL